MERSLDSMKTYLVVWLSGVFAGLVMVERWRRARRSLRCCGKRAPGSRRVGCRQHRSDRSTREAERGGVDLRRRQGRRSTCPTRPRPGDAVGEPLGPVHRRAAALESSDAVSGRGSTRKDCEREAGDDPIRRRAPIAVRIDGDEAVELGAADVGELLRADDWLAAASAADGARRPVDGARLRAARAEPGQDHLRRPQLPQPHPRDGPRAPRPPDAVRQVSARR